MARKSLFRTEEEKAQRLKERRKAGRIRNKDKIAEQNKRWRDKNTEVLREKEKERKSTEEYKAAKNAAAKRLRLLSAMYDAHVKLYARLVAKDVKASIIKAMREERAANPPPPNPKEQARLFFLGIGMKLCSKCNTLHGLGSFHKNSGTRDGLMSVCKDCDTKRVRENIQACALRRVKHNVRSRLRAALIAGGFEKKSRTHEILGCDFDQFKAHIIKQFTKGMKWELMGDAIHIDHIIPLASATTEDEIIALNHFTNLRPTWAADNLKKGAKREFLI